MDQPGSNDYFERRAEEERAASERAIDKRAAQAHRDLAKEYRKRAGGSRISAVDEPGQGILNKGFQIIP
jgi:hypothetical protein